MDKTLKLLIWSDISLLTGFGLIGPILAIYFKENLIGGSIFAAGLASAIFLITVSILQIWFAKKFNPKDRLWMLWLGTTVIALVPFAYLFAKSMNHIYIIQFVHGIGAAFAYPAWRSLFACTLEKGKRGLQWSMYASSVSAGTAVAAVCGSWLAENMGFKSVFILTGILALIGAFILFKIDRSVLRKV
jgi:DHA1 family quinolone resistance protein-like MFS transporter